MSATPSLVLCVEPLSPREQEVLEELSDEGQSNAAIGVELFISAKTVRTHIHNVMEKLGANTRTQAVLTAQSLGLVATPNQITGQLSPVAVAMLALIKTHPAQFGELVEAGLLDGLELPGDGTGEDA